MTKMTREEMRTSKTVYMKMKHLDAVYEMAAKENISLSQAFDQIIQRGLAYGEVIKHQKTLTETL